MPANEIKNLPESLAETEAAYRDPVTQLPLVGGEMLARRVDHFASSVQFGLHERAAMRRLHKLTKDLGTISRLDSLLPAVLEGALSLMKADLGNIQIVDPAAGALRIVTQAGFGPEFLEHFAVVGDGDGSACGRAATQRAQTVVADVRSDPDFAPHRDIAGSSGFRGVQSTPLVDYAGHLIGMVSTHFRRPYRPADRELRIMEIYSDLAGEAVTRRLGISRQHDPGDPLISALLDGGHARQASAPVPFELWVMGQMAASFTRRDGRSHPDNSHPDNNGQGS
jgi:GAF domain-containing protein